MSIFNRVGRGAFIYTATNFLQKGIAFLLLPLYTRFLTPDDYGVLTVVTSLNSILSIFITLSLHAAATRFYFEYRSSPEKLRVFWGTIFTFLLLVSTGVGIGLLLGGEYLLKSLIGEVSFWPYVALGLGSILFQPYFMTYLYLLQTKEQAGRYAILSLAYFILNVMLTIALVVLVGWGAEGPLTATLSASIFVFGLTFYFLRHEIQLGIHLGYLKEALAYSLPLVPHSLASQLTHVVDKLFINRLLSTSLAGIYNIGFLISSIVTILADNINRGFVPVYMDSLTKGEQKDVSQLRDLGTFLVCLYCCIGATISIFAREIIFLVTTRPFFESHTVIPILSFTFVLGGIYYVIVNVLFYEKKMTRYLPIATGIGAITNISLNWMLIPILGILGAAWAAFFSNVTSLIFVAALGRKHDKVKWDYPKFLLMFFFSGVICFVIGATEIASPWMGVGVRAGAFLITFAGLNAIAFGQPFYLLATGWRFAKKHWPK